MLAEVSQVITKLGCSRHRQQQSTLLTTCAHLQHKTLTLDMATAAYQMHRLMVAWKLTLGTPLMLRVCGPHRLALAMLLRICIKVLQKAFRYTVIHKQMCIVKLCTHDYCSNLWTDFRCTIQDPDTTPQAEAQASGCTQTGFISSWHGPQRHYYNEFPVYNSRPHPKGRRKWRKLELQWTKTSGAFLHCFLINRKDV